MSAETSHYDVRGEVLDSQRQDASIVVVDDRMMNALPVIRQLVSEWLQGLLVTMSFHHQHPQFPDRRTSSYDGHPLSEGFPFPITIQPALGGRSILPLVDLLEDLPLLSQREDQRFWVAREILASDFEVVLLQSELFHWVEELVDGYNQLYWGVKAYLVMYGYHVLRLRWIEDVEGMMSPVVWELRWRTTVLGALELDRTMFAESGFQRMMRLLTGQFVLQSLILSVQTRTAIVLVRTSSHGIEFMPGRRL
ncbi:hypothetical protein DFH05DRAFT_1126592 [Lentinula detonsa]|uniref:Uncharacterized protein n=1 Tax=Lentinula detonsa TaxID=2804962 RepID=A0A9W8P248_9AGAR|nr:hypothetical protein DFH05DRAFT_1126592 [Lentinula detonsa]